MKQTDEAGILKRVEAGQVSLQAESDEKVVQAGDADQDDVHQSDDRRLGRNCPNCLCTHYRRHGVVPQVKLCANCHCRYNPDTLAPSVWAQVKRHIVNIGGAMDETSTLIAGFSFLINDGDADRRVHGFYALMTNDVVQYG